MRQFFPLLLLVVVSAQAQTSPSIDRTDMPVVGDSLRLSQAAALPAGAPPLTRRGPNQTWNYAALAPTAQRVERYRALSTTNIVFQLAFGLPGPNQANLASPQALALPPGTTLPVTDPVVFFRSSAADFRAVGSGVVASGLGLPVTFVSAAEQDIIYRFPLSYSSPRDSSTSAFSINLPGTVFFAQRQKRVNRPDAWGTLTTPYGTFQTVRVVTRLSAHDSLAVPGQPGTGFDTPVTREYKWLAKTVHVPVLKITTTQVGPAEIVTGVEYRDIYRRIVPLGSRDAATDAALAAYPNPSAAGSPLALAVPAGSGPLTVTATDVVGRRLFRRSFGGGAGVLRIEAEALGNFRGVLLLTVQTAQGTATRRVVRE